MHKNKITHSQDHICTHQLSLCLYCSKLMLEIVPHIKEFYDWFEPWDFPQSYSTQVLLPKTSVICHILLRTSDF
ncbi:hypothetical protein AQUCO_03100062v1 [Aquilegia coerulea]|uniref:Uncharacterized protein n=1 Tax=Aquilegia coerulea TaxID=218851 RepID=A0A2G5D1I1_AQUCA|nr:hypothetical protein AQUCO_03100062v1 [Aquilegia coerulea]